MRFLSAAILSLVLLLEGVASATCYQGETSWGPVDYGWYEGYRYWVIYVNDPDYAVQDVTCETTYWDPDQQVNMRAQSGTCLARSKPVDINEECVCDGASCIIYHEHQLVQATFDVATGTSTEYWCYEPAAPRWAPYCN